MQGILNSPIRLALLVFLGMIAVIASVLAFEHLGGYIPCALCLKQREPYYAAIPVGLIALIGLQWNWPKLLVQSALVITGLLVMYSLALAAYHSGVEWAWWAGPSECAASGGSGETTATAESLLSQLSLSKPPSCDEAAGRFLGLSFAGWNVVVSAIIASMAFRAAAVAGNKN
ncbi:MAG: disulfide bond formation protein B [Rhizobiaceae bacterium]|nr:disulfide bond formation protein B [Rhizobiaceae bacterium]